MKVRFNLITKAICFFATVFIPFFLIMGFLTQKKLEQQIIINTDEAIGSFVRDESGDIETHFKKLELLGQRSADFIETLLKHTPNAEDMADFDSKYQYTDGALRSKPNAFPSEDVSGVFLSSRTKISDEIKKIIITTEGRFDDYAKGIKSTVFNTYFITKHQLIRIYEKNWALEIEANHDFTRDLFYYMADPQHNPERIPRWTSPYYDSIWKHWMISLITPVYVGDNFLGIAGHDVILDDIYSEIFRKKYFDTGYGFIFDKNRNIIIHPHYLDKLLKTAEMGTLLSFNELNNNTLSEAITKTVLESKPVKSLSKQTIQHEGTLIHFYTCKLDFLDWYFAVVVPNSEVVKMLPRFRNNFFLGAAIFSFILFAIIVSFVWFYIVSPIAALTRVANKIRSGDLNKKATAHSQDEIGNLARAFNDMTGKLNKSLQSLENEIMEHKQSQEKYARLITAIEQTDEYITLVGTDGIIQYLNRASEQVIGYQKNELIGSNILDFERTPEQKQQYFEIWEKVTKGNIWSGHIVEMKKDGTNCDLDVTVTPLFDQNKNTTGFVSIGRDITKELKLEEQLRQTQKMEAIGTLAGGIAHDFNNILSAIFGYTELSLNTSDNLKAKEYMEHVLKAAGRAKDLVQQILAFSRKSEDEKKPVKIGLIVKEVLKFLKASLPSTIEIQQVMLTDSDIVLCDPVQIHQLLMNLCTNAGHAMREKGGILRVSMNSVYLSTEEASGYADLRQGQFLRIEICDTGTGIAPQILERIFEPYFTTKSKGEGTGLGLSVVHGIVKGYGGNIKVESKHGNGSTFTILLPATVQETEREEEHIDRLPTGSESILLVDDELPVLNAAEQILESLGYRVTSETDSRRAFNLFCSTPNKFDMLITDQTMPHLTGYSLSEKILEICPDFPIILCTGHSSTVSMETAKALGIREFIMKPVTMKDIAITVHKAFNHSH